MKTSELKEILDKNPKMKNKMDLHDIQKMLAKNGELCNNQMTVTRCENKLGQALIDKNIQIIPNFKIDEKSFDFKVFHYPILIEVDGNIHNDSIKRAKDYQKDRMAIRRGFRVLRFSNWEVDNTLPQCVEQVQAIISNHALSAREIWLYPYSFFDKVKHWYLRRKK